MKYLLSPAMFIFLILYSGCGEAESLLSEEAGGLIGIDSEITEQDANNRNFDLITPEFGMRVSIRGDVEANTQNTLESLDMMAADFLTCQFMMGADIGFGNFDIGGEIVPPLSELRVFVVPFNFECNAVDRDICAGIYFRGSDLIVISEMSLGRCGELPLWRHELGHRYGMNGNHDNQAEFEPCIDPPVCDFGDFLNVGVGG